MRLLSVFVALMIACVFTGAAAPRPAPFNPNVLQNPPDTLICFGVWEVEAGGRNFSPPDGDNGRAVGPLQVHTVMVDEVNRIQGLTERKLFRQTGRFIPLIRYTYDDRRRFTASADMFFIFCFFGGTSSRRSRIAQPRTGTMPGCGMVVRPHG